MFSQGFAFPVGLLILLLKPCIKVKTFCSGLCLEHPGCPAKDQCAGGLLFLFGPVQWDLPHPHFGGRHILL